MKKWIALLLVVVALGAAALAESCSLVGQAMPDFTAETTEGEKLSLSQLLETKDVVVLNIFTSWCPPCRMEFPEMERAYRDLSDRMEIVAVSDEPEDTMEIIADYKAELGLSFPMGLSADVADAVPIDGYPTTVVIGKDGRVGYFQLGSFVSETQFRGIVDYFLDEGYDGTPVGGFNVYVCDQDMEPVPGATVQFCTDTACRMFTSDADGFIAFADKPESYHVQVLKAPEGYSFDPDFETECNGSGEWVIVQLTKD